MNNNLSRDDIAIRYVFQKMFSQQGKLVAVECLSRFDNSSISPEEFFRRADSTLRETIFLEQIALAEKHQEWFVKNGVFITINVDDHILNIMHRDEIEKKIARLKCLHFEVTEYSASLLDNVLAAELYPLQAPLWLDDFGSGHAGIHAMRSYHFNYVKIDKDFFWHLTRKEYGRQLMEALVTFLSRNNHHVVIEGIENEAHKTWLNGMEWFAMQGHYWQEVSIEQLICGEAG